MLTSLYVTHSIYIRTLTYSLYITYTHTYTHTHIHTHTYTLYFSLCIYNRTLTCALYSSQNMNFRTLTYSPYFARSTHIRTVTYSLYFTHYIYIMGWLPLAGSLKLQVSFAKKPHKRDYILQKRPIILRSLLIVATL